MSVLYNIMLLISHHVQLLSDAVHLLSVFTIGVMLSWVRDGETENLYSETKLMPKCVLI